MSTIDQPLQVVPTINSSSSSISSLLPSSSSSSSSSSIPANSPPLRKRKREGPNDHGRPQTTCSFPNCTILLMAKARNHRCPQHKYIKPPSSLHPSSSSSSSLSSSSSSSSPPSLSPFLLPSPSAPLHTHLSIAQRYAIVVMHELVYSNDDIHTILKIDKRTIHHWIEEAEENDGEIKDAPRTGRPKLLPLIDEKKIEAEALSHPINTPRNIRNVLEFHVSARTVRRILDRCGLFGRKVRRTYPYDEKQIKQRLSFAKGYSNWGEREWGHVIFSDESTFFLYSNGDVYCQRGINEEYKRENMVDYKRHSEKVNVWGCFSGKGIGECYIFDDNLDNRLYISILNDALFPSIEELIPENDMWWLLQDNSGPHRHTLTKEYLHNNGISCIDFPPYSPDLNPIENIWAQLKNRVQQHHPKTKEELKRAISIEWLGISEEECDYLTASMEQRCKDVINNNGERTKY